MMLIFGSAVEHDLAVDSYNGGGSGFGGQRTPCC
jgi:hypothetical protein